MNLRSLNLDAWSDGQMTSKLWLCHELEKVWDQSVHRDKLGAKIWIYGAWYGTLAQCLLIRERIRINKMVLFDLDKEATEISRQMTTAWWLNNKVIFEFKTLDCGAINTVEILAEQPDLVINTSCEHFSDYKWFEKLPKGQRFLAQTTDMKHPTHILNAYSLVEFKNQLGTYSKIYYEGTINFNYTNFSFDRFMIIGVK